MLELIAAIWVQEVGEVQPVESPTTEAIEAYPGMEAECEYYGDINGQDIENLQAVCPSQAPYFEQLQVRADAVTANVPEPVRSDYSFLNENLLLTWNGEDWVLQDPLLINRHEPVYPAYMIYRGFSALCAGLVIIDNDGSATPEEWECKGAMFNGLRTSDVGQFIRSAEHSVQHWKYLPPSEGDPNCVAATINFGFRGGPSSDWMISLFPPEDHPQCPPEPWEAD